MLIPLVFIFGITDMIYRTHMHNLLIYFPDQNIIEKTTKYNCNLIGYNNDVFFFVHTSEMQTGNQSDPHQVKTSVCVVFFMKLLMTLLHTVILITAFFFCLSWPTCFCKVTVRTVYSGSFWLLDPSIPSLSLHIKLTALGQTAGWERLNKEQRWGETCLWISFH